MTVRFSGVIAIEGVQTGDGRVIANDALIWADLPLPLAWLQVEQHSMPGDGIQIGIIDSIGPLADNGEMPFDGLIDDEIPEGAEVVRRLNAGTAPFGSEWGVSIDADDFDVELVAPNGVADDEVEVVLASARRRGGKALYILGARTALTAAAGDPDPVGAEILLEASADEVIERATRLRIRGGTLCAIPAFDGARIALAEMPAEVVAGEDQDEEPMAIAASVFHQGMIVADDGEPILAAGFPIAPPVNWFDDPLLPVATPLTLTDEGRVFGHLGTWDKCHDGFPDRCLKLPRDADYGYFTRHGGKMRCAEGCEVEIGVIVMDTNHARMSSDADKTTSFYDHTGSIAAFVAAGTDRFGPWVAGCIRPDLSEEDILRFRATPPSVDLRPVRGGYELRAVLMVPSPGYPVHLPIAASAVPQEVLEMAAERLDARFVKGLDEKISRSAASNR